MCEEDEGIEKCKLADIKIAQHRGCKIEHRKCSQYYCNNYAWCQTGTRLIGVITS